MGRNGENGENGGNGGEGGKHNRAGAEPLTRMRMTDRVLGAPSDKSDKSDKSDLSDYAAHTILRSRGDAELHTPFCEAADGITRTILRAIRAEVAFCEGSRRRSAPNVLD